ncbi:MULTISPECIES: TolC family outer membrane protein [Neptunomonas]|uniref:TolC family outer membrane protein n=1 Tax=Neptunomonas TaxID=75687 RepID=UPI0025B0F182|nr:TolC family outer membrane protein [Neptunomonas sp. CHC150]MDN2661424.1 TolC family outer membrane protein [Neptunomonas sp. CHC150]
MVVKRTLLALAVGMSFVLPVKAVELDQVVTQAVLSNPDVKSVMNARNAIYEEINQAKGGFYPRIDIAAGIGYEWTDTVSIDDVELKRREASFSIDQMLFDGFLTDSEVDRHSARLESSNHRLREVAEETALESSRAYLEVLKRKELLSQAKETLYNHVRVYDQIKRRTESGLGTLASNQQAEGRLALAEVNVLTAENNLLDAEATFQRVTGEVAPEVMDFPLVDQAIMPATSDEAVKRALEKHPTILLADSDVEAARAQYESARSLLYPTLNFEVDRNWNNNIDGVRGDNEDLTAMFRLRYNLYNGGSDKARVRQTHHQINEAREIQASAKRQTLESIELSWGAYEILKRQLEYLEKHVVASTQTRDSYFKQFNIGQRSLLDLLDTENEVFSSKNAYISAKYDFVIAQYRLLSGMGEILDMLQVDVAPLASTEFSDYRTDLK